MKVPKVQIVRSRAKKLYTRGGMNGKLQYHVRVLAPNGRILMSSETYNSRLSALKCAGYVALAQDVHLIDESGD